MTDQTQDQAAIPSRLPCSVEKLLKDRFWFFSEYLLNGKCKPSDVLQEISLILDRAEKVTCLLQNACEQADDISLADIGGTVWMLRQELQDANNVLYAGWAICVAKEDQA